jgi:hypothetical protein
MVSSIICGVVETQIAKYRVEYLVGTLGFDHAYGVKSSSQSGGLCIYVKSSINLHLKSNLKYHIDMEVEEPRKGA